MLPIFIFHVPILTRKLRSLASHFKNDGYDG